MKFRPIKIKWQYLLQELLIVILGILIAFSINKCSETIKEKTSLRKSLESIHKDLSADDERIDTLIKIHSSKATNFLVIKSLLHQENVPKSDIQELIANQIQSPTFYPKQSGFKSMLSNNELGSIQNIELRKSLIDLYESTYERLIYNGHIYDKIHIEKFNEYLIPYFDFETNQLIDIEGLKNSVFLNSLAYLNEVAKAYTQLLEQAKNENETLRKQIFDGI